MSNVILLPIHAHVHTAQACASMLSPKGHMATSAILSSNCSYAAMQLAFVHVRSWARLWRRISGDVQAKTQGKLHCSERNLNVEAYRHLEDTKWAVWRHLMVFSQFFFTFEDGVTMTSIVLDLSATLFRPETALLQWTNPLNWIHCVMHL